MSTLKEMQKQWRNYLDSKQEAEKKRPIDQRFHYGFDDSRDFVSVSEGHLVCIKYGDDYVRVPAQYISRLAKVLADLAGD